METLYTSVLGSLCLGAQSCPTLCNPMDCSPPGSSVHGDSPRKNTAMRCHAFLQEIFPTQGSNQGLLHCRQIFLPSELPGKPLGTLGISITIPSCNMILKDDIDIETTIQQLVVLVRLTCFLLLLSTVLSAQGHRPVVALGFSNGLSDSACLQCAVHEFDKNYLLNSGASFASLGASFLFCHLADPHTKQLEE